MSAVKVDTPAIYLVNGKCGSGKSYLVHYLVRFLWEKGHFDGGLVISSTCQLNGEYDWLPKRRRYPYYDEAIIERLLERQQAAKRPESLFLILDDCLGDVKFGSKLMKKLMTQYRHFNITIFVATQFIHSVPFMLRSLANYVAVFKPNSKQEFEALHRSYFTDFTDWRSVRAYCNRNMVEDYQFVFIKHTGTHSQKYQVMKAPWVGMKPLKF